MNINNEEMKKILELNEPVLIDKLADKLQPRIKVIYLGGLVLVALMVLASLLALVTMAISQAILGLLFAVIEFVIIRMLCEFIAFRK